VAALVIGGVYALLSQPASRDLGVPSIVKVAHTFAQKFAEHPQVAEGRRVMS
jgi:hypothetical protein